MCQNIISFNTPVDRKSKYDQEYLGHDFIEKQIYKNDSNNGVIDNSLFNMIERYKSNHSMSDEDIIRELHKVVSLYATHK